MGFRKSIPDELLKAFDPHAHALTVITEPHRMIHDGFFFSVSGKVTGLADAGTHDILFKFPAGTIGHLTLVEYTLQDAPVELALYENVVVSADGTPANVRNHNRVVANDTSNTGIFLAPTVTDIGDLLDDRYIPTAGKDTGQLVPGEDAEWVLGNPVAAKNYMYRLTNNSGAAIDFGFHFSGYEIGY